VHSNSESIGAVLDKFTEDGVFFGEVAGNRRAGMSKDAAKSLVSMVIKRLCFLESELRLRRSVAEVPPELQELMGREGAEQYASAVLHGCNVRSSSFDPDPIYANADLPERSRQEMCDRKIVYQQPHHQQSRGSDGQAGP